MSAIAQTLTALVLQSGSMKLLSVLVLMILGPSLANAQAGTYYFTGSFDDGGTVSGYIGEFYKGGLTFADLTTSPNATTGLGYEYSNGAATDNLVPKTATLQFDQASLCCGTPPALLSMTAQTAQGAEDLEILFYGSTNGNAEPVLWASGSSLTGFGTTYYGNYETLTLNGVTTARDLISAQIEPAVPLPASVWLLLSGLVGVGTMVSKRRIFAT